MNILAIDTSTEYLTVAVTKDGKVAARFHRKIGRNHSTMLVPTIDGLLKRARMKLKDLDAFAVGIGPGSFTGLRIGIATIKALAYSLKKPIAPVPTFDAIAENVKHFKGVIVPILDARKSKVYGCFYRSDGKTLRRISKYLLISHDELLKKASGYDKVLMIGDMSGNKIAWHPKAPVIERLGAEILEKKKFTKPEDLEPMYLYSRECDITGK